MATTLDVPAVDYLRCEVQVSSSFVFHGCGMDVLSAVLRELRLQSASYRLLRLRAPWRVRFDGGLRGVHVVVEGECDLTLDGVAPRRLRAGDLVVLPRADSHTLGSTDGRHAPLVSSLDLVHRARGARLTAGGAGAATNIVCGAFLLGHEDHPAVAGFPRCIHVTGAPPWLTSLTDALATEATEGGPGSEVVMARLSDALITRALRHHVETADEPGWLQGLRDPYIARALAALHADLAAPWTLESLARTAGLSRAAFAARFAATVGQTPMKYLYQCRMRHAMTLLTVERATAASIAPRVGYGSEAAFAAAFTRHAGITPAAYRRRAASSVEPERRLEAGL
ncbi:MAG TPA: AraC family transcriptional regulator [Actinophytocola sp.]|jgi:AraC-like DNA-binding protein|uniref:AraC family transcriptional regulator n=1 Tax=Actinophytocola sp. TaxID=1872138 RepID=UPI002F9356B2